MIGRIEIFDEHSTVDMLAGMPPKVFETLKQVKIGGRRLNISRLADGSSAGDWPVTGAVKLAGKAASPALPSTSERENRPAVEITESTVLAPTDRSAGKKLKVKLKPKFAGPKKVKGTRSSRKRLLPTR